MDTPPGNYTDAELPDVAAESAPGMKLSRVALYYCVAALFYQVVVFGAAGSVMTSNWYQYIFFPTPFVILAGIVLCLIAGTRGGAARKRAVIGGILLAIPFVVFVLLVLVTNLQ